MIQNNEMFAAFLMGSSELSFSTDSVGNIAGRKSHYMHRIKYHKWLLG